MSPHLHDTFGLHGGKGCLPYRSAPSPVLHGQSPECQGIHRLSVHLCDWLHLTQDPLLLSNQYQIFRFDHLISAVALCASDLVPE